MKPTIMGHSLLQITFVFGLIMLTMLEFAGFVFSLYEHYGIKLPMLVVLLIRLLIGILVACCTNKKIGGNLEFAISIVILSCLSSVYRAHIYHRHFTILMYVLVGLGVVMFICGFALLCQRKAAADDLESSRESEARFSTSSTECSSALPTDNPAVEHAEVLQASETEDVPGIAQKTMPSSKSLRPQWTIGLFSQKMPWCREMTSDGQTKTMPSSKSLRPQWTIGLLSRKMPWYLFDPFRWLFGEPEDAIPDFVHSSKDSPDMRASGLDLEHDGFVTSQSEPEQAAGGQRKEVEIEVPGFAAPQIIEVSTESATPRETPLE